MATATINGKPSVFITPTEIPTARINPTADLQNNLTDAVRIANDMVTETETEMTDEERLNDPEFQAEYNEWLKSLETPEALDELDAWVSEQERLANEEVSEHEAWEAHLEAQAEEAELARLGDAGLFYIAGHDAVWQQGGEV